MLYPISKIEYGLKVSPKRYFHFDVGSQFYLESKLAREKGIEMINKQASHPDVLKHLEHFPDKTADYCTLYLLYVKIGFDKANYLSKRSGIYKVKKDVLKIPLSQIVILRTEIVKMPWLIRYLCSQPEIV